MHSIIRRQPELSLAGRTEVFWNPVCSREQSVQDSAEAFESWSLHGEWNPQLDFTRSVHFHKAASVWWPPSRGTSLAPDGRSTLTALARGSRVWWSSRPVFQLELQGMRIEEGTDSEADSEFLMELMDINEVLNEAQTAREAEQIGRDVQGKQICKLALSSERAARHWSQISSSWAEF